MPTIEPETISFKLAPQITSLSLGLPGSEVREEFLVTGGDDSHVVFVGGEHQWHGFAAGKADQWKAAFVTDCIVEADLEAIATSESGSPLPGSLVRRGTGLYLTILRKESLGFKERRQILIKDGMPASSDEVGVIFPKWCIKVQIGQERRLIRSFEASASSR